MLNNFWLKCFHVLLPKRALTLLAGVLAETKITWLKNYLISRFIADYQVDMQEAQEPRPELYPNFNAFFIRALKPGARPIATADMVSPVDGYLSEFGAIVAGRLLQAKQREYRLHDLLACSAAESAHFEGGSFATFYLSPRDYHRVHMPVAALLQSMIYVPGQLFSVQPATTRVIPRLFARNERVVVFFETEFGPMAMVLVGATIVGRIATVWHGEFARRTKKQVILYTNQPPQHYQQGAEMGYFKLGSTVIVLWSKQARLNWAANLEVGRAVRQGQAIAQVLS